MKKPPIILFSFFIASSAYAHGFQIDTNLGAGAINDTETSGNLSIHYSGPALRLESLVGYEFPVGISFGGYADLVASSVSSYGNRKVWDAEVPDNTPPKLGVLSIGSYLGCHLYHGLDFVAMAGFARFLDYKNSLFVDRSFNGFSLGVGFGYSWPVSKNWKMGMLGQVDFIRASGWSTTMSEEAIIPTLGFDIRY